MRGDPFLVGPFTGGMNTRDALSEVALTHTQDAINVIGNNDGTFRKRNPHIAECTVFTGAGSNNISSLYWSGVNQVLYATAGSKLFSETGGASTDITGAFVLPFNSKWSFIDAPTSGGQGPVYGLPNDLTTVPKYITGPGVLGDWTASAGTLDKGDFMIYFKNRVIMFGLLVGTSGCGLKASKVGDPRGWDITLTGSSDAWLTDIDPTDGQKINAMGIVGNYLVVFKQTKTYIVYDLDTGANRPLSTSVGCAGQRTVVNTPYGLVFMAGDGHIYVTDGAKISKLSDIVSPPKASGTFYTRVSLGETAVRDNTAASDPCAVYFQDRYYLSVQDIVNTVPTTWVYDFPSQSWWRNSVGFGQMVVSTTPTAVMYGAVRDAISPSPRIYKIFTPNRNPGSGTWQDNGVNFNAYYTVPPIAPFNKRQERHLRRRFHAMRAWIAGDLDIQTSLDTLGLTAPTFTTVQSVNGTDVDYPQQISVYSLGVANTMQFRFTSTDGVTFEVHPFEVYTQQRTD